MKKLLKKLLRKIFYRAIGHPEWESSEANIKWMRSRGIRIGEGTKVIHPRSVIVDGSRPELITIGENVLLHHGTVLMTHDYASRAFVNRDAEFIPSHGRITIGNNVWLGRNVTILKDVTIGDNVIIGLGSVVSKSIPSNSVAIGSPAKVICTFDEYMAKRRAKFVDEVRDYAIAIYESGRTPTVADFINDYPAFVDGTNWQEYDYPYDRVFTESEKFEQWKRTHKAPFHGFEEFMKEVDRVRKSR